MQIKVRFHSPQFPVQRIRKMLRFSSILGIAVLAVPLAAYAQTGSSPFDSGFTSIGNLFTGTIAKVASLVAIVIGGYGFAHGEPGAKNSRFAYVSVSRASQDAQIYTNDAAALVPGLSHDATKTSAVEVGKTHDVSQGAEHGAGKQPAQDIGAGFSL
jgi:type IV secretory pathway VirB2 component (pilin)